MSGDAAAAASPGGRTPGALQWRDLSMDRRRSFERGTGGPRALAEAVNAARAARAAAEGDAPAARAMTAMLASHLQAWWQLTGDDQALLDAVALGREAAAGPGPGELDAHRNLCGALVQLFGRDGGDGLLTEAIEHGRRAVALAEALADADGRPLAACVANLTSALFWTYQYTQDRQPLDEAIRLAEHALDALAPDEPDRPVLRNNLSNLLRARHGLTADRADLDRAYEHAVAAAGSGELVHLASAAAVGLYRYRSSGDLADVETARELCRRALAAAPPGDPRRAALHNMTCAALQHLAGRRGDPEFARQAADAARAAVGATPAAGHDRPGHLRNLAGALQLQARLSRDTAPLAEAVPVIEAALDALGPDHPDRADCRGALGEALLALYAGTGDERLVDAAVESARAALDETRRHPELRGTLLVTLSSALRTRHSVHRARPDLDEAITTAREAARRLGPTSFATGAWDAVSAAYGALTTLPELTPAQRLDALRAQADAARRAADLTPSGDALHPHRTGMLGWILLCLAAHDGSAGTEALDRARGSLAALPPGTAAHASAALACGSAIHHAVRTGHADPGPALAEAEQLLLGGLGTEAATASDRLGCARELARLRLTTGRPGAALAAVTRAVDLLPATVPGELARGGRERGLEVHGGLSAEVVAIAVAAGRPDRAVALLERARGVLLTEELAGRRARGGRPARPAPHPADRPAGAAAVPPETAAAGVAVARRAVADAEQRRRDWSAQVRRSAGAGRERPRGNGAVVVTAGAAGGHALIIRRNRVRAVELPLLREAEAVGHALRLSGEPTQRELLDTLGWLWEAATEPVLRELAPRPGARVWWCPTGPLAALPLHAAGRDGDGVMDRVVSSYTPTVRMLEHARAGLRRAERSGAARAVVVAVPDEPGAEVLPQVRAEAEAIARLLPGTRVLLGGQAGYEAVAAALPDGGVAHFACHAFSDPAVPAASGIALASGGGRPALTLADLSALDLPAAQLAYLSACETGRTRLGLADEAVHLAAGFQLAGYPQVIATLWTVSDRIAARIAREVYQGSVRGGRLSARRVPGALHEAVQRVRQRWPRAPELWAGHQHYGA
ncbi:CHAT domain-containing protein [Streptomyces sp. IBSBF 2435]|uniref:CHAT domain-containing protein n=1 Tax=Streptomyces sp. IBSBF 2435 TaxID=2903531 RepID=UPI002FDBBBA9